MIYPKRIPPVIQCAIQVLRCERCGENQSLGKSGTCNIHDVEFVVHALSNVWLPAVSILPGAIFAFVCHPLAVSCMADFFCLLSANTRASLGKACEAVFAFLKGRSAGFLGGHLARDQAGVSQIDKGRTSR